jgi:arsenate reductase-like glutaredoxin family protein
MDFNYDDIFGGMMDDLFITFYSSLIPDEKERETIEKILTVFKKHGIKPKDAFNIMMDLSEVLTSATVEVSDVSVDTMQMAYNILRNAYYKTKINKDELRASMQKAVNILNPKNRKEKDAAETLNIALKRTKITKDELREAIKRAAEDLCK